MKNKLKVLKAITLMLVMVITVSAVPVTAFATNNKTVTIRDEIILTGDFDDSVLKDTNYAEGEYIEGTHPGRWDSEWIDMVLDIHVLFSGNVNDVNLNNTIKLMYGDNCFLFINEMNWDNVYFPGDEISFVPKEMWLFRVGSGVIIKDWTYYNSVTSRIPNDYQTSLPKEQADAITQKSNYASSVGMDDWTTQEQFDLAVKDLEDYLNFICSESSADYTHIDMLYETTKYANLTDDEKNTIKTAYDTICKTYTKMEQDKVDLAYSNFMNTVVITYGLHPQHTEICDYTQVINTIKTIDEYKDLYATEELNELINFYMSFDWKLGKSNANQFTVDSNAIMLKDKIDILNNRVVNTINQEMRVVLSDFYALDKEKYEENSYNNTKTYADKQTTDISLENIRTQKANVEEMRRLISELILKVDILPADYTEVEKNVRISKEIDRTIYTEESLQILDIAVNGVIYGLKQAEQNRVDKMALLIKNAYEALVIKNADYTEVNKLVEQFESLNRVEYTDESYATVANLIKSIQWNLLITRQSDVDKYASDLKGAIEDLKFRPADYTQLDRVIATIPEEYYKYYDNIDGVQNVIALIHRDATFKEQAMVNKWAADLETAISNLTLKKADYSRLNELLKTIPNDLTVYSKKSVAKLNEVLNGINYELTIFEQDEIDGYVTILESAINGLTLKKTVYKTDVDKLTSLGGKLDELFDTVDELIGYLKSKIEDVHGNAIVEVYDVTAMSNTDEDGWKENTDELKEALKVILPCPENTSTEKYDYFVYHMYNDGEKVGEFEKLETKITEEGIIVYSKEFSPYAVVAVEKTEQKPEDDNDDKNEGVVAPGGTEQQPAEKPNESTKAPQTGDIGFMKDLLSLCGSNITLLGIACVSLRRKKESE